MPNLDSSDSHPTSNSGSPFASLVKSIGGVKAMSALFGMLLLAAGVGAGVVLVMQPQLFNQQAAVDYRILKTCENGLYCSLSQLVGGSMCNAQNGTYPYCCPLGNYISNGVCVPNTVCGGVLKADAPTCTTGTLVCKNNAWTCGTACTEGNLGTTCTDGCPAGKAAYLYRRSDCTTYCNVGTDAANCTLDIAAPKCTDANGNTLSAPSLLCTSLSGTSCTNYKSCSLSKGYDACDPIPGTNQCRYEVNGTVCTGACPGNMPPGYARCQCNNGVWTIGQIPAGGNCNQLCACTGNVCNGPSCSPKPTPTPPGSTATPTSSPRPTPTPTRSPSPTPTPTQSPSPSPMAVCSSTRMYTPNWTPLSAAEFYNLPAGGQVYFCVNGVTNTTTFDMARFTVNGVLRPSVTLRRPGSSDFCDLYTIPANTYTFTVQGEIHSPVLGWQ